MYIIISLRNFAKVCPVSWFVGSFVRSFGLAPMLDPNGVVANFWYVAEQRR